MITPCSDAPRRAGHDTAYAGLVVLLNPENAASTRSYLVPYFGSFSVPMCCTFTFSNESVH